jgi:hypothetical protein
MTASFIADLPGLGDEVEFLTVTIPARYEHEGRHAAEVTLPWRCLNCGGPRGEPQDALSYDGAHPLRVKVWKNPCGHFESYSAIRDWIRSQPPGLITVRVAFGGALS